MLLKRLNEAIHRHAELVSASRRSRNKFGMTVAFNLLFLAILVAPNAVLAAQEKIPLPNPLGTTNILDLGARLIQAGLGIAGSLALLFFIYGGFLWLTSGGSPDKIKKGRDVFLWSVVGLVIIFSSYLMVDFVIKAITANKTNNLQVDNCQIIAQTEKQECAEPCKIMEPVAAATCDTNCAKDYKINLENCLKGSGVK
ncbi:MAG: pilin [Patescibacteria group bacterium]